jgi:hypothetical protein
VSRRYDVVFREACRYLQDVSWNSLPRFDIYVMNNYLHAVAASSLFVFRSDLFMQYCD